METINLETTRDEAFLREVEAESGQKVTNCYQCGNCTAGCPCGPEYDLQVSQVMRAVQLGNKEMALSSRSLWLCVSCSTCTSRCPNNIDVAKVMDVLRHMAWKEGKTNYAMASFWQSFLTPPSATSGARTNWASWPCSWPAPAGFSPMWISRRASCPSKSCPSNPTPSSARTLWPVSSSVSTSSAAPRGTSK